MRSKWLLLTLLCWPGLAQAGNPRTQPPTTDTALANYLRSLENHLNTLECLTANPDGTANPPGVLGGKGELKCAIYGGINYVCMNTSTGPQKGTAWTCLSAGGGIISGTGADTQVTFWTGASTVSGDEGFTFTSTTNLVNINEATDGDSILLLLANDQANVAGSTNETAQLRFGFGTDTDVARIVVGKEGAYTGSGANSSFMAFYTDEVATATEEVRIQSGGDVGIGVTNPTNKLEVNGNMSIGSSYVSGTGAPTDGLIVSGQVGLGTDGSGTSSQPTILGDVTIGPRPIGGQADLYLRAGTANNSQLWFTDAADDDIASISETPHTTSPHMLFNFDQPRNGYFVFETEDNSASDPISDESHGLVIAGRTGTVNVHDSRSIALSSGVTVNGRYNYLIAPTYAGVAGGAAETVNLPATLYIDNEPQGTNVTWGAGPYALWVDDGDVRFDGAVTYNSTQTSAGDLTIQKADPTLIYDVVTATDTDFWAGVQDDAGSDDDDLYQIGKGTTPGTTPYLTVTFNGHLEWSGTAPIVSACGGGTPSIVGNDVIGKVTIGTGVSVTACTVTFDKTWANAPACMADNETQILLVQAIASTTVLTLNAALTMDEDVISYHCLGRR